MESVREVVLYGGSTAPFELVVERLCQKYHKLPSEVLEEDVYWLNILMGVGAIDMEREQLEEKRNKLKNINKDGSRYAN
jgi:hypothetical protein